jgi:hypothetical protein
MMLDIADPEPRPQEADRTSLISTLEYSNWETCLPTPNWKR